MKEKVRIIVVTIRNIAMKEEIRLTYLHVRDRHFELSSVILLYRLKDLLDAQGDQSRLIFARVTSHGESFTR